MSRLFPARGGYGNVFAFQQVVLRFGRLTFRVFCMWFLMVFRFRHRYGLRRGRYPTQNGSYSNRGQQTQQTTTANNWQDALHHSIPPIKDSALAISE
ncbi:hypothetical protein [Novacetimonas cocois]|uniref:hypothetical protein n=1 Tax=Novacetimonas cocois TaxID=1747507 RepID=UPI0014031428|nr:hypothetical protein [Novacetimonas cocois]